MNSTSAWRLGALLVGQAALGVYYGLFLPVSAAGVLAGILALLGAAGLLATLDPLRWILLAPFLYLAWLLLIFAVGALEVQLIHGLGYSKPRRAQTGHNLATSVRLLQTHAYYCRAVFLWSLPLTRYLQVIPLVRHLVLLSYARHVLLGPHSLVFGYLYDPDLTDIGAYAVIGAGSAISCHSVTTTATGFLYVSAPVHIGSRAILGGEARVAMGVRIGADALVEPGSIVAPFTVIGPGEVWGGNPAVFLRRRAGDSWSAMPAPACSVAGNVPGNPPPYDPREAVRQVIAEALELPVEAVGDHLSATTCAAWDSLAHLAIAAALHGRFGIQLGAEQVFRLGSFTQVLDLVRQGPASPAVAALGTLPINPELLPLLDREATTIALAARAPAAAPAPRGEELRVVIAATFTAEPLAFALKLWSRAFGIDVRVEFVGFNQVEQALLDEDSPLRRNRAGLNVVLVRTEVWGRIQQSRKICWRPLARWSAARRERW